jgi:hypothetical protein
MLRKIFFWAFWVTLSLPLKTNGQDRNVIWLHGFNGQSTDWQDFNNQFNNTFKITGFQPRTYSSSLGIQAYATNITNLNSGRFTNNLITIGHSMGGVVARRMDLTGQANLGGLITVGSPLDGAGIASSVNFGFATAQIQNGVNQVSKGPIASLLPIIRVFNVDIIDVINSLTNNGLAITPSSFGQQTINDLQLGGGITNDMFANPTNLPKVSIYGNEESPVHWKVAAAGLKKSQGLDLDLENIASIAEDIYYTSYVVNNTVGVVAAVVGFWNPFAWFAAAYWFWQADQWKQGYDWLCDSERIWNVLIGANIGFQQCFTYQAYICYYPSNSSSCWQTRTSCFTSELNGQSDGFIPANSQTGVRSTSWLGVSQIEAFGVNHLEEIDVNNGVMQTKFAQIFDNQGTYFFTNRR